MKTKTNSIITAAIALASLGCGAAFAGEGMSHENHGMAMMDTNKDGKVSGAEHSAWAQKMFTQADADKDGKVTAAELDAAHKAMKSDEMKSDAAKPDAAAKSESSGASADMKEHHMSSAEKIKEMDTDGDNALTLNEFVSGTQMRFSKLDTNKDGNLSAKELKAGHEKEKAEKAMAKSEE
ncbi:MAG: EF-hand domain-containing protein [Steroidobacteraceae bacterium]